MVCSGEEVIISIEVFGGCEGLSYCFYCIAFLNLRRLQVKIILKTIILTMMIRLTKMRRKKIARQRSYKNWYKLESDALTTGKRSMPK